MCTHVDERRIDYEEAAWLPSVCVCERCECCRYCVDLVLLMINTISVHIIQSLISITLHIFPFFFAAWERAYTFSSSPAVSISTLYG